jgi:enhancer of polycomb-like protein
MDSLDKLNMIRDNVAVALTLFELLVKRERKKRDMTYVVTDWQQLQMKQKHEHRAVQDAVSTYICNYDDRSFCGHYFYQKPTPAVQIEQEYLAAAKKPNPKRPVGFDDLPEAAPAATNALLDFKNNKKNKKRCEQVFLYFPSASFKDVQTHCLCVPGWHVGAGKSWDSSRKWTL